LFLFGGSTMWGFGSPDDQTIPAHLQRLLGVEIPQTTLPVAAGRNLAILAETAVRQHLLRVTGYDAAAEFSERQRGYIEANQQSSTSPHEKG
jgi:HPr kinase/phosphorylase